MTEQKIKIDKDLMNYCSIMLDNIVMGGKVKSLGDAMFFVSTMFNGLISSHLPDEETRVSVAREQHKINLKLIRESKSFERGKL